MRAIVRRVALVGLALAALAVTPTVADAKSLYVIANINASPTPIQTYDIQGTPTYLVFQATQGVPAFAGGAVGIAIDTDNRKLFVTYEVSNTIQLLDATNFANLGTTTAPGASNLAGIVVDQGKRKVYTVDRETNHLYVYSWDAATNTLTLDGGAFKTLTGVARANGIALDESRGRLYIGDRDTTTVRYFDTTTWAHAGSVVLAASGQTAMGVAIDTRRNLLYAGNAYGPYGSRGRLVKYDLTTDVETFYTLPGATTGTSTGDNIVGVAVDEDTGHVYATTGNQGTGGTDTLMVFDLALNVLKNDLGDLGDPTGLAIPRASISFNPLNFSKVATANPIASGSNVTYRLCYANPNEVAVTNVRIVDTLPAGMSFVSATGPAGAAGNVVTWTIGTVAAGAAQACHDLVASVSAAAGSALLNSATITSDTTPPTTQTFTTDVSGGFAPLFFEMTDSADPVVTGTNLTYQICVGPGSNAQTVNNVVLTNPIPAGATFVSASGAGTFNGTQVTWLLGNLAPETAPVCVDLVLTVTGAPGTQVVNTASVTSDNTAPASHTHPTDVIAALAPMNLRVVDTADPIASGATELYRVCYDNVGNTLPVNNVVITVPVPGGTTYVSATGPVALVGNDVTWTIGTVAAGAPQVCHDLALRITAPLGSNVVVTALLTSSDIAPVSAVQNTTVGLQPVVVEGKGEGGGSLGPLQLLAGLLALALAPLQRRRHGATLVAGALVAALGLGVAQAAGPGWYVGAGGGGARADATAAELDAALAGLGHATTSTMDRTDTGWKVFAGYRLGPFFAVEAAYVDLGKVTSVIRGNVADPAAFVADVVRVHPYSVDGITLSAIGMRPIGPSLTAFARLGVFRWDADIEAKVVPAGVPISTTGDSGTDGVFGVGLRFAPGRWGVQAEWERYKTGRNDVDLVSISVVYLF